MRPAGLHGPVVRTWLAVAVVLTPLGVWAAYDLATGNATRAAVSLFFAVGMLLTTAWVLTTTREPPEGVLWVIHGRSSRGIDGEVRAYRVAWPGSSVTVWPFLDRIVELDARPRVVAAEVRSAYARDNVPMDVSLLASVTLHQHGFRVHAALERFPDGLGAQSDDVARETLEGTVRHCLGREVAEACVRQREAFGEEVTSEASEEFDRLGLSLQDVVVTALVRSA